MDLPKVDRDSGRDRVGPIGPTRWGWGSTRSSSTGREPEGSALRSNGGSREAGWGSGTVNLRPAGKRRIVRRAEHHEASERPEKGNKKHIPEVSIIQKAGS